MIAYSLHGKEDLRAEEKTKPTASSGHVIVKVKRMGICGSDIHYYTQGYCGAFKPKRPFILGHEFSGQIVEIGEGVNRLTINDRVAIDPSHPCRVCEFCITGRSNLCENMRFLGSASVDPHVDGAFCEFIKLPEKNCFRIPSSLDYGKAALIEPLSVCIHATEQAGDLFGKNVLIIGGGTIGQLLLQVVQISGTSEVCVSDIKERARDFSLEQGANVVFNPLIDGYEDEVFKTTSNGFDVVFEASGAASSLKQAIRLSKKGGKIVQVGTLPSDISMPANLIMVKELTLVGSFRFRNSISTAINMLTKRKDCFDSIITHTFPFDQLVQGIEVATNDETAIKVQIALED